MRPLLIHEGRFSFRFQHLTNDELLVWFETTAGRIGPVTLRDAEAKELGAVIERAIELFTQAQERVEKDQASSRETRVESDDTYAPVPNRESDGSTRSGPEEDTAVESAPSPKHRTET